MTKKILIAIFAVIVILLEFTTIYANSDVQSVTGIDESQIIEVKKNAEREITEYTELYGTEAYGMTGYILSKVRIYSIPFCFVGITIGAIYQYTIGIRRLDIRDRGFKLVIGFVTLLVLCQVLPLIFAIVIRGWRS